MIGAVHSPAGSVYAAPRRLLNASEPLIRYDASYPARKGPPADRFLDDQWVIGNVLLSAVVGFEAVQDSHAGVDTRRPLPDKLLRSIINYK